MSQLKTFIFFFILMAAMLPSCSETVVDEKPETGAFLGAKEAEYPNWFKDSFLDFNEDIKEAAADGKRVLLIFHQDNCPYCAELVEQNFSQKDIVDKMQKNLDAIGLNMWGDREIASVDGKSYTEKTFAEKLKVQFTPTLIFFNEDAKQIVRLNGYLPPNEFIMVLDYVSEKKDREMSLRDYAKTLKLEKADGKFNQQPFFQSEKDLSKFNGKKPLAVFFEQKHCPNCDVLHQKTLQDKDTLALINQYHAVQLDMWSDEPVLTPDGKKLTARDWAGELGIQYAPTIVLFDSQGKEIIRSEAFFKSFHTQSLFDYILSGGYKKEPNFQRWISARAEHIQETGKDVDIWK